MLTTSTKTVGGQVIWHDTRILPKIDPLFFDIEWHQKRGGVTGSATGRGAAHFLHFEGYDLVLRPFRRGGLIGKINADFYLRLGAHHSRSFQEYSLLEWMGEQGLPVPRPVAARYEPIGLCYRADLVTQFIPQSRPLADILQNTRLPFSMWSKIGTVVRQMHRLGVYHSDLNCRNILIDSKMQVWLIDFDKGRRRKQGKWQAQNLERLKRSLVKERTKQPDLFWEVADWDAFLTGYND